MVQTCGNGRINFKQIALEDSTVFYINPALGRNFRADIRAKRDRYSVTSVQPTTINCSYSNPPDDGRGHRRRIVKQHTTSALNLVRPPYTDER